MKLISRVKMSVKPTSSVKSTWEKTDPFARLAGSEAIAAELNRIALSTKRSKTYRGEQERVGVHLTSGLG